MGIYILILFALVILWLVLNFIFAYWKIQRVIRETQPLVNTASSTFVQLDRTISALRQAPSLQSYQTCSNAGGTTCIDNLLCNIIFNDLNPQGSGDESVICDVLSNQGLNCPQCVT